MGQPLKCIIMDYQVPGDYIEVFGWGSENPPSMSRDVEYTDVPIRGRSEPYVFYSHTGPQIWEFTFSLYASIDSGDNGTYDGAQEKASFIESLIMPDYGDVAGQVSVVQPPHLARIYILQLLDLVGTIRKPQWIFKGPYDMDTGRSQVIGVSFPFHCQRSFGQSPLGYADIRRLTARGQNRFSLG